MQTQMTMVSACITLFLVLDAPGNVPFFLSILKDVPPKRRRWVMVRELLIALAGLVAFLLGSTWLFKFLGESVLNAVERVMGMLLIALSAQMILGGVEAYLRGS
jgi:small neutral amino acid transporter SnatA (MarC family)